MPDAKDAQPHTSSSTVAVVFVVAGHPYAVPALHTREVLGWRAPRELPGADPWIEGVINLRGEIVPVCDLAHALGMRSAHTHSEGSSIIIVETGESASSVGFTVDEVRAVVSFRAQDIVEAPGIDHPAMAGIIRVGEELVVMLDPQQALAGAGANKPDTHVDDTTTHTPPSNNAVDSIPHVPDDDQSISERPAA
jgi:purine-binding chemotaxis protein CheW